MRRIEWTSRARNDLAEIDAYWWAVDPDLAETLLNRIEDGASVLSDTPQIGRVMNASIRKWNVRGTPYLLLYRSGPDRVEIIRVQHGSRNWQASL